MINDRDVDFMKSARRHMVAGRRRPVVLMLNVLDGTNPITGQKTYRTEAHGVLAVVTELSGDERMFNDTGTEIVKGDIQFSVSLDEMPTGDVRQMLRDMRTVEYDGERYTVIAGDLKGIGERNRIEFVGRRES